MDADPRLEQVKADARLPAVARMIAWCTLDRMDQAPKVDAAAHELHVPRSTAARAIAALVATGHLRRAA